MENRKLTLCKISETENISTKRVLHILKDVLSLKKKNLRRFATID